MTTNGLIMKSFTPLFWLFIAIIGIGLTSCDTDQKKDQGIIFYDVSFPFLENSVLKNVFPAEMKLTFKDNNVKADLQSLGGIVASGFMADGNERTYCQVFKSYQEHYKVELDASGVDAYNAEQVGVRLEPTDQKETVAGYECDVTIAHFLTDSVPPITLYHTQEIDVEDPNWFTQYKEIDGVLLGYEIEQFGMRMRLLARQVSFTSIPDEQFEFGPQYNLINTNQMKEKIQALLEEYMD